MRSTVRRDSWLLTFLAMVVSVATAESNSLPATRIDEFILASNDRRWRMSYDIGIESRAVTVTLRVRLIAGDDLSRSTLTKLQEKWEQVVEGTWSDQYALIVDDRRFKIIIDVDFTRVDPHHTVIVKSSPYVSVDQLNWSRWTPPQVIAHEFGHMIGAYDEYRGGSLDPETPIIDQNSVMGGSSAPETSVVERHYSRITSWVTATLKPKMPVQIVRVTGENR